MSQKMLFWSDSDKGVWEALSSMGLVLAGGYVRDHLLRGLHEPNDMDFVIPCDPDLEDWEARWAQARWFLRDHITEEWERNPESEDDAYPEGICLCKAEVEGRVINILLPRRRAYGGEAVVAQFNWSINQCWVDPEGNVQATEHFWYGARTKQVFWTCRVEDEYKAPGKYRDMFPDHVFYWPV